MAMMKPSRTTASVTPSTIHAARMWPSLVLAGVGETGGVGFGVGFAVVGVGFGVGFGVAGVGAGVGFGVVGGTGVGAGVGCGVGEGVGSAEGVGEGGGPHEQSHEYTSGRSTADPLQMLMFKPGPHGVDRHNPMNDT